MASWFIISEYEKSGTDHNTDALLFLRMMSLRKICDG